MSNNLKIILTPEERELEKKTKELAELESQLVQKELELATLRAEIHYFERKYVGVIGVLYGELDELEAQIAEAIARSKPSDVKAQQEAATSRDKAAETARTIAADSSDQTKNRNEFIPSADLKKLYREIAKMIHPDLALDEKERKKRQELMAAANVAYENGNEAALREILSEWLSSPDAVKGEGAGSELVRIIRKIAQVESRLAKIDSEIEAMKLSELFQLKTSVEQARKENRDLLDEISTDVKDQISQAKEKLRVL